MTHRLIPNRPVTVSRTSLRDPPSDTEAVLTVLHRDRRLQFTQRLAVLIRRMHTQPQARAKEELSDEH